MLILGSTEIQGAVADEFRRANVPYQTLMLAPQSAANGSVKALVVAIGTDTALAATALLAWFARNQRRLRIEILLMDGTRDRRQIQIESASGTETLLLLAQAREVVIEKRSSKRNAPKSQRVKLPARLRTKLIDEVRSCCPNPKCGKKGVTPLEAHHIDGNPSRTVEENLLMLCANCHGEADRQLISRDEVTFWKHLLVQCHHPFLDAPNSRAAGQEAPVVDGPNFGHAARNLEVHYHGAKPTREKPGDGTIGADPKRRAYVRYLGQKYIEWRLKGTNELGDTREFNPKAAWSTIQNALGFAPYKAGIESFPTAVEVLTNMIDRTPFGSFNRSQGRRNYHSFEEHVGQMVRKKHQRPKNPSTPQRRDRAK